jgi:4-aminobutyrate aminotransferase
MKFNDIKAYTQKKIDKSLEIVNMDKELLPRAAALKYFPIAIEKGSGSFVWDIDGNKYIDFLTNAAVYNIGHRHPKVVEAIQDQVSKLFNYTIVYLYRENPVHLAKLLIEITPGKFKKKVTFGFSGSDANDSAMKAARAFTKREYILSFKYSYHGTTYGALALTGIIDAKSKELVHGLDGVELVEFPDPFRNSWGIDGYSEPDHLTEVALHAIENKINELKGNVAGIIIEPIQGDAGVVIPPQEFIKELKILCEKLGIVFVAEEVQTGMGRTGKMWAIEHFGVEPDLLVTAKALGGGMPISALIGRAEIMESVPPPLFAFTHEGHAVNTAAALATIEVTLEENLPEKAKEMGSYIRKKFEEIAQKYPIIGDIRNKGLLIGVDIVKKGTKSEPDKSLALKICWRAWEKGLLMITFGKHGNVLRIAPPLNIEKSTVDEALEIIESSIKDAIEGKVPDKVLEYLRGW